MIDMTSEKPLKKPQYFRGRKNIKRTADIAMRGIKEV